SAGGLTRYIQLHQDRYAGGFQNCRGPLPGLPAQVTTDENGRFRLTGLGCERVVTLAIEGPAIGHTEITTFTRPPVELPQRSYGATFDFVAGAGRSIGGVVRDQATGQPVPGVKMSLENLAVTALTGPDG